METSADEIGSILSKIKESFSLRVSAPDHLLQYALFHRVNSGEEDKYDTTEDKDTNRRNRKRVRKKLSSFSKKYNGQSLDEDVVLPNKISLEKWWETFQDQIKSFDYNFKAILNKKESNRERYNRAPNTPFIENHYIKNNFFLKENQLIKNKNFLKEIPISIIQGEYDLLCPPINSFLFSNNLSNIKLIIAEQAGHYISDPGIKQLMKKEIDEFQFI